MPRTSRERPPIPSGDLQPPPLLLPSPTPLSSAGQQLVLATSHRWARDWLKALDSLPHPREQDGVGLPLLPRSPSLRPHTSRPCPCLQAACPEKGGSPRPRRGSPQTSGRIPPPPASPQPSPSSRFEPETCTPIPPMPGVVPDSVSPTLHPKMQLPKLFLESERLEQAPGPLPAPGLRGLLLSWRASLRLALAPWARARCQARAKHFPGTVSFLLAGPGQV